MDRYLGDCPEGQVQAEDGTCVDMAYFLGQPPVGRPVGQLDPAAIGLIESLGYGAAGRAERGAYQPEGSPASIPLLGLFGGQAPKHPKPLIQYANGGAQPEAAPTPSGIRYSGFDDFNRRRGVR